MSDFYKYHGLGNDYLVIDPKKIKIHLSENNIRLICDRNRGVGSDGILYGPIMKEGRIAFRIFNPDGSEAEKSGNGIRIFARYLKDAGYVKENSFTISTISDNADVEIIDKKKHLFKVNMGRPSFNSKDIPMTGEERLVINEKLKIGYETYTVTCLSIGNPHCVIILDDISKELANNIGPKIENDPLFPRRINVQFVKVINRNAIELQIWERGAGYTLASGSSSCAAVSAAHKLGLVDTRVTAYMPGGELEIDINPDGYIHMTGTVISVCEGVFSHEFLKSITE